MNILLTVFVPMGFEWGIFAQVRTYVLLGIFAVMLLLSFKKAHPILIICLSAAIGVAVGYMGLL